MAAAIDKENCAPHDYHAQWSAEANRNPLDMLSDAKADIDKEIAFGEHKKAQRSIAMEKAAEERAGAQLAVKLHNEEHDAALAVRIQKRYAAEAERVRDARRRSVAEDEKVARELAAALAKDEADTVAARAKQDAEDSALALRLQSAEDVLIAKRVEELKWTNPAVSVTQQSNTVRFAVKLPGLAHANVCISHQTNGEATLAIEAIPITPRNAASSASTSPTNATATTGVEVKTPAPALLHKSSSMQKLQDAKDAAALQKFLFDFKLTSSTPLQLDAKDIAVQYDEKTEELAILCSNLKLNEQQKQSFVDKLKAFFGAKKKDASEPIVKSCVNEDANMHLRKHR